MLKRVDRRGQIFEMSFQMIFSIFLIIVFIIAAGIAARTMINNTEHARIVKFIQALNSEIERVWMATTAEKTITLDLPPKIEMVCFADSLNLNEGDFPSSSLYESARPYIDEYRGSKLFFYNPAVLEGYEMTPYREIKCGSSKKECLNLGDVNKICCIRNKNGITLALKKDIGNPDVIFVPNNCIK